MSDGDDPAKRQRKQSTGSASLAAVNIVVVVATDTNCNHHAGAHAGRRISSASDAYAG